MIKKIVLITIFVLFAGVLIAGGLNRTSAKSGYEARSAEENHDESVENEDGRTLASRQTAGSEAGQQQGERKGQGQGNGGAPQGGNQNAQEPAQSAPQGVTGEGQAYGRGQGNQGGQGGQGQGGGQGARGQNQEKESAEEHEAVILEGEVIQAPAAGVDMILSTGSAEVLVGTGPGYLQEQGFELAVGDSVQVIGFWENDEFKATTITRVADGLSIALRDEFGRPMWSGAARGGRGQGNQGNQAGS